MKHLPHHFTHTGVTQNMLKISFNMDLEQIRMKFKASLRFHKIFQSS